MKQRHCQRKSVHYWWIHYYGPSTNLNQILSGAIPDGQGGWKLSGKTFATIALKNFSQLMDHIERKKPEGLSNQEIIKWIQAELKQLADEIVELPGNILTTREELWFEEHKAEQEVLEQKLKQE